MLRITVENIIIHFYYIYLNSYQRNCTTQFILTAVMLDLVDPNQSQQLPVSIGLLVMLPSSLLNISINFTLALLTIGLPTAV